MPLFDFSSLKNRFLGLAAVCILQSCGGNNLDKSEAFTRYNRFLDSLTAQSVPFYPQDSLVADNINGIRQESFDFFNSEGYNIDLEFMYEPLKEKTLEEIKKKYSITGQFTADTIQADYFCFGHREVKDSVTVSTVYYVIGLPQKIAVISYRAMQERNRKFELRFNRLAINDSIPKTCFSNMQVDSIRFAGRFISLGPACAWQGINNIQCRRRGQMNWSEFQDPKRAADMLRGQIALSKENGKIDDIQCTDVVFEGQKTKALKMSYHIPLPKMLLGGSNTLIAYYVVAPVRNRYVACVLSHYDDDAPEGTLPPLLDEVMDLPGH